MDRSGSTTAPPVLPRTAAPAAARPMAARTRLLLEGPPLPTLLRLAAPIGKAWFLRVYEKSS